MGVPSALFRAQPTLDHTRRPAIRAFLRAAPDENAANHAANAALSCSPCSSSAAARHAEACSPPAEAAGEPEIAFTKFVLDNGLTLIVHEDHKAPIVAVNVWYHVGSKNEKPGKTGFAHLFEHLMFNGSENYNDDYFGPFERVGATDMNGTTNADRTNYFQNVPSSSLDLALWMESDRMGHLLGAIDQERLDEQRGVVQNEKRQGDNQPYGQVFDMLIARTPIPKATPTRGPPSDPWRISTLRASRT